jgi:hypothetical protein
MATAAPIVLHTDEDGTIAFIERRGWPLAGTYVDHRVSDSREKRSELDSSPERVVAVVTRGGESPGTRYLHADHLGSVHAVTNDRGTVDEWRSYDPYGLRRSPIWGEPAPPSNRRKTTTMSGKPIVLLDSPPLTSVLTSDPWRDRVLGETRSAVHDIARLSRGR